MPTSREEFEAAKRYAETRRNDGDCELKPCPFCGGKAAYDGEIGIICECGYYRQTSESKQSLFASWNRRAPNPLAAPLEKLAAAYESIRLWFATGGRGIPHAEELVRVMDMFIAQTRAALAAERKEK